MMLVRREKAANLEYVPLGEPETYSLHQWIDVPNPGLPLRVHIYLPQSLTAKLLRLAYKPPEFVIAYQLENGKADMLQLVARMAEEGFLIAPYITNDPEFIEALSKDEYAKYKQDKSTHLHRIKRFTIFCVHLQPACPQTVRVSFETVPNLELGRFPVTIMSAP